MNTSTIRILGALALCTAIGSIANANPIDGSLTFTGGAVVNSSSANTATGVGSWQLMPTTLTSDSGTFASLPDSPPANPFPKATIVAPWSFNDSSIINDFLSVGGFTFTLKDSQIWTQGGGAVTVIGTGWVNDAGFSTTLANISFTFTDPSVLPSSIHSFSVLSLGKMDHFTATITTVAIPDGGTTAVLLGVGLLGLTIASRRRLGNKA